MVVGIVAHASRPVSSASLALFRVLWALVLAYECVTYLVKTKKLEALSAGRFHFPFYGFEWIPHLPVEGFLHRLFSVIFAIGFTYLWLIDLSEYLNHFYLVSIFTMLCAFLPLNAAFSLDNVLIPETAKAEVPAWTYQLMRAEIAIVYFYAAIAKINVDWLRGEPLRHWLLSHSRELIPGIGPLFKLEIACYLFSYAGLFFDLIVPVLLLCDRTRVLGFVFSGMFHVMNKIIFNIGIFPAAMGALTTLFLPQDWPLALWAFAKRLVALRSAVPKAAKAQKPKITAPAKLAATLPLIFIGLFLVANVIVPIRFLMYPGDVAWHEHGHRFSWRMKLRDKSCEGAFILQDPLTNVTTRGDVSAVNSRQESKMWARPEMVVQFARYLADEAVRQGAKERPRVYAEVSCSLNFRPSQLFMQPDFDLASHGVWDWPFPFITELRPLSAHLEEQFLWRRLRKSPRTLLQPVKKGKWA